MGATVKFTSARDLVAAGLLAAVVIHILVRSTYGSLPPLPALAGITLLLLAVVEAVLGFVLRSKIRHPRGGRPIQPLTAARAVALAKASSLLGAIMLGAWLGVLGYVFPRRADIEAAAGDTTSAIIGVICAAALIGGGLWLEYCCRSPHDEDEDQRDSAR